MVPSADSSSSLLSAPRCSEFYPPYTATDKTAIAMAYDVTAARRGLDQVTAIGS